MRRISWKNSFGLLALFALAAPSVYATDAVVGPGQCDETGFTNALAAVDASGGGTVSFACGTATIVISNYKEIANSVTIDGGGTITLDGNNASAFFQVFSSANATLRRLKLKRGAFSSAHALENFGSLTLDRVELTDSASSSSLIANSGTLRVLSSRFADNTISAVLSNDSGDALVSDSKFERNKRGLAAGNGAIESNGGTLAITHSAFTANEAADGGAIYIAETSGAVRIASTTFTDNTAGYGAAIENWGSDVKISDSTFSGNQAGGDGGAIWTLRGTLEVLRSQFVDNKAGTTGGAISCYESALLTVLQSAFGDNQSGSHGGAIYSSCAFMTVNSTFNANTAVGASSGGGAIYQTDPAHASLIVFATIAGNSAGFGGGFHNENGGVLTMYIGNTIVSANTGGNCAGVLGSNEYNLSDDGTCGGVFTAPGDINNAAIALQPFANHGGPTSTMPPQAGSAAIDHVPLANCGFPTDQRGASRPAGTACDSGAYEVNGEVDLIFADGFETP